MKNMASFIGFFGVILSVLLLIIILQQPETDIIAIFFIPSLFAAFIGSWVKHPVFLYISFVVSSPLLLFIGASVELSLTSILPIIYLLSAVLLTVEFFKQRKRSIN